MTKLTGKVADGIAKVGLKIKGATPEILVGLGIVGVVGAVVLACKETMEADEIIEEYNAEKERIEDAIDNINGFSEEDVKIAKRKNTFKTIGKFAKLYAPATAVLVCSLACILCGHGMLKKRDLALTAAYEALENGFKKYRAKIADELGEEKEQQLYNDITYLKANEAIKAGDNEAVTNEMLANNPMAFCFDESSILWSNDPVHNASQLSIAQTVLTNTLRGRNGKFIFLNEIREACGLHPIFPEGNTWGVLIGKSTDAYGRCIDRVNFQIVEGKTTAMDRFIEGYEPNVWIEVEGLTNIINDINTPYRFRKPERKRTVFRGIKKEDWEDTAQYA